MIKCVIGTEKEYLLRLTNKFIDYQDTEEPLEIRSVVILDHLKGYIYNYMESWSKPPPPLSLRSPTLDPPPPGFLKTYFFHTYLVLRQLRHHLQNIKIKFFWCLQFLSIISFLDFCCLQTSTREAQLHCIEKAIFFIVVKSLFRNEKFILDEIVLGDT